LLKIESNFDLEQFVVADVTFTIGQGEEII
jgi:hypothetical protein